MTTEQNKPPLSEAARELLDAHDVIVKGAWTRERLLDFKRLRDNLESALAQPMPQPVAGPGVIEAANKLISSLEQTGAIFDPKIKMLVVMNSDIVDLVKALSTNDPAAPVREALEDAAKWCEDSGGTANFTLHAPTFDCVAIELRRRAGLLGGVK